MIGGVSVKPAIITNMDINNIIFSRTTSSKKAEIVNNLSATELLSITPATITRIIRGVGTRLYKSRDKQIHIQSVDNDWNSSIEGVRTFKGNPILDIYIQYENTDTTTSVSAVDFLNKSGYRGRIERNDRNGNPRSYYFTYTADMIARFARILLLEYLNRKYK